MENLIRELPLANGLTVRFFDTTRRYFGDYHQVRVKISCEVPVTADLFADQQAFDAALKLLGAKVQYVKDIEQQGVPTLSTADAVANVIRQFMENSLGYFDSAEFSKRFVQSELNRIRSKAKSFVPLRSNG
jgi:hypothetical protein